MLLVARLLCKEGGLIQGVIFCPRGCAGEEIQVCVCFWMDESASLAIAAQSSLCICPADLQVIQ